MKTMTDIRRTHRSLFFTLLLSALTLSSYSPLVDAQARIQFSTSSISVNESAGTVDVEVIKPKAEFADITVDFATSDGSARAGVNYTAQSGTLTWLVSEDGIPDTNPKLITITILDNDLVESAKSFNISLSNPQETGTAVLGDPSTVTVEINDDDPQAGASLEIVSGNSQSATEPGTLEPFVARLTTGTGAPVENALVTWSVSPANAGSLQTNETRTDSAGSTVNTLNLNETGVGLVVVTAVAQGGGAVDFMVDTGFAIIVHRAGSPPPAFS